MHPFLKSLAAASTLGLVAALPSANAQLLLSGSTYGEFVDPGHAFTTVTNGATQSTFASGTPYRPFAPFNDTQTSITFTGSTFNDVGNGDQLDLGAIDITNGRTLLGTTAHNAAMDLYLNLPEHGIVDFKLTTLLFTIDSTANNGSLIPDLFLLGHTGANQIKINNQLVTFDLQFTNPEFGIGDGAAIGEGTSAMNGIYAYLHFTPVPEPSTYALWGAVLLVGLIAFRRFRTSSATAT